MSKNFFNNIVIAINILFADNSKALVMYSPPTQSISRAIVVRSLDQNRQVVGYKIRHRQPTNLADVKFNSKQIQKKYKHAQDFNLSGSANTKQFVNYQSKLQEHIDSEQNLVIKGTYRDNPVVHYLNPETKVNVIVDLNNRFVSGWKLSEAQFDNVKSRGSL